MDLALGMVTVTDISVYSNNSVTDTHRTSSSFIHLGNRERERRFAKAVIIEKKGTQK